ncbi:MAG: S8 family serine peptidase [Alistipes sp.]|nr:S8 family serine peptidase [Candidatus Alistipes equi]
MKKFYLIASLIIAFSFSCTKQNEIENVATLTSLGEKYVNTPDEALNGSLLVYLSEDAVKTIEATGTLTRSSVGEIDMVLREYNSASIERLFPIDVKHEARTREAGLHHWYVVRVPNEVQVEKLASSLASLQSIERVEFNKRMIPQWKIVNDPSIERTLTFQTRSETRASYPFNDPLLHYQWSFSNDGTISEYAKEGEDMSIFSAWEIETGDKDLIVSVCDEGVAYSHSDLKANMWVNEDEIPNNGIDDDKNGYVDDVYGYNFQDNGPITWDKHIDKSHTDEGHGTHVAGTISAVNGNGVGVCGIAGGSGKGDGVRIMSAQIFSAGYSSNEGTSRAVKYSADNGACILQCSFGYGAGSVKNDETFRKQLSVEYEAYEYFRKASNYPALDGGLLIFAAGNEEQPMSGYPAGYTNYCSVTSIGYGGYPAGYTNYGPGCNICATGGDYYSGGKGYDIGGILSTLPESYTPMYGPKGYDFYQGTSMACPHVSGVAALGLSYAKRKGYHFTVPQFKAIMYSSVRDIDTRMVGTYMSFKRLYLSDFKGQMGTGLLDAYKFLLNFDNIPCLEIKTGEQTQIESPSSLFVKGNAQWTIKEVTISASDMEKLGMTTQPQIIKNSIYFVCKKSGNAKMTIKFIAGGSNAGSDSKMGGDVFEKEVGLIVRHKFNSNNAWL